MPMPDQESRKTLEEIVREVGLYPLDAFIFIQECVGFAAELVHGPLTPEQTAVARWMAGEEVSPEDLRRLESEGQLPFEVAANLQKIGGAARMNRHVTGQDLCRAVRDAAIKRWGLLALTVLKRWNLHRTEDIGQIIFALVDNGWLQKQPTDTIHDFENVFPFDKAFDTGDWPQD